jgi:hypothetical protein
LPGKRRSEKSGFSVFQGKVAQSPSFKIVRDVMECSFTTARRGLGPAKVTWEMGVDDAVCEGGGAMASAWPPEKSAFGQLRLSTGDNSHRLYRSSSGRATQQRVNIRLETTH